MTAELTEQTLSAWIKNPELALQELRADELVAVAHTAIAHVRARGQEPVAWRVDLEDSTYIVDDIDDAQLVDDCTNHDATVTPLYESPQPTYRDGLLAAAKVCEERAYAHEKASYLGPELNTLNCAKAIRKLAEKEG